jgi:hypothetical protein
MNNLEQILAQDPRIIELKQRYQTLMQQKNARIMEISHIEADIIKTTGIYETICKEIIAKLQEGLTTSKEETEEPDLNPVDRSDEAEISEANEDDGFADAKSPSPIPDEVPPTAENPTGFLPQPDGD